MSVSENYIVVNKDSAVVDAFNDLAQYIDSHDKTGGDALASVASQFAEAVGDSAVAPKSTQKLFEEVVKRSHVLMSSPPAEFEATFNLLWFVMSSAPDFDALIPTVLEELTTAMPTVHGQRVALLAVLGSLFNITPAKSAQKPAVFAKIVELASLCSGSNQFVPQLPQIADWLQEWQFDGADEIALQLAEGITGHEVAVLLFLKSVAVNFPSLTRVARKLVDMTLRTPSSRAELPLEKLVALEAVKNLANSGEEEDKQRVLVLQSIAEGDYAKFLSANGTFQNDEVLRTQARIAAISRMASQGKKELTYAEIASALSMPEGEVEPVIVSAAKSGIVRGRLNQLNSTFAIEHASLVGPVTDAHWDTIEARLQGWKKSLSAILELSEKAKNNHDLVKAFSKLEVN